MSFSCDVQWDSVTDKSVLDTSINYSSPPVLYPVVNSRCSGGKWRVEWRSTCRLQEATVNIMFIHYENTETYWRVSVNVLEIWEKVRILDSGT